MWFIQKLIYFKNEEKIITKGSPSDLQSEYNIKSENVEFKLDSRQLSSKVKSVLTDNNNQIYYLDEFLLYLDQDLLKGKGILTITNYNLPKSDKFYFSNGIFNLKNKEFVAKETEVNIHKNVFDRDDNEPRILSVSSKGDDNLTVLKKAVFTSCQKRDGCPPWSIKSSEIIHDKEKKQLTYKNAVINVLDIPVFYFPKFFHPDPSVVKQSGFLTPEINGSNVLGSSFTQPYFWKISDSNDLTITPTISDNDFITLQNEYRQANKNSNFLADFGFVKGYISPTTRKKIIFHTFF